MDCDKTERFVFDIKRFALHDGPGIRTTAFLKGCPLRCTWCHNPEGLKPMPQIWYTESQCIHCRQCVTACPVNALEFPKGDKSSLKYDRNKCTLCGTCVRVCPSGALRWDSQKYTVSALTEELFKDSLFHEHSGGGITLSGGEPMARPDFALKILEFCRNRGVNTAIETSLYAPRKTVMRFLPLVDLFLTDLKISNDVVHRQFTGVGNTRIKQNMAIIARGIAETSTPENPRMIVRIPLIPGITDTDENVADIARYVADLQGDVPVELLNFNPLAESKYRSLGLSYPFLHTDDSSSLKQSTGILSNERIESLKSIVRQEGCRVF